MAARGTPCSGTGLARRCGPRNRLVSIADHAHRRWALGWLLTEGQRTDLVTCCPGGRSPCRPT